MACEVNFRMIGYLSHTLPSTCTCTPRRRRVFGGAPGAPSGEILGLADELRPGAVETTAEVQAEDARFRGTVTKLVGQTEISSSRRSMWAPPKTSWSARRASAC